MSIKRKTGKHLVRKAFLSRKQEQPVSLLLQSASPASPDTSTYLPPDPGRVMDLPSPKHATDQTGFVDVVTKESPNTRNQKDLTPDPLIYFIVMKHSNISLCASCKVGWHSGYLYCLSTSFFPAHCNSISCR